MKELIALLAVLALLGAVGHIKNHERKGKPALIRSAYGCYIWSDGKEQCQ